MNNHWYNEGIEILNQGRSKKQMEGNYKIGAISIIGMVITFIAILIFGQKSKSKLFTTHINNLIRIYRMIWLGKLLNVVDVMRRSLVDGITGGILISILMSGGKQKIRQSISDKQQLKLM